MSHPHTLRLRVLAGASAGLLAVGMVAGVGTASSSPQRGLTVDTPAPALPSTGQAEYAPGRYVVVMRRDPAATYTGGVRGYSATAPRGTASYDSTTAAARSYTGFLRRQQADVATDAGVDPYYHYTTALDGFAARLSSDEAKQISKDPRVLTVVRDEQRTVTTDYSPSFLGLSGSAGVWRRLGGTSSVTGAGNDVIIGVIDSGIDPDAPSLQATPDGNDVPADWNGVCDAGDGSFRCNDKLIGGRFFTAGAVVVPQEKRSPADVHGHGTHVATTAAGNAGVPASIDGIDFGRTSGMAPGAKVASYKVCWQKPDLSNCSAATSDSVAAIDAATRDGVDVINYSISGATDNVVDPVELAFMYSADAGVFVAASAGNEGPGASTVNHPSPWLTTVAASTHHNRESTLVLGNGTRLVGASTASDDAGPAPLAYAGDHPAAGSSEADAAKCLPNSIDASAVSGAIVICDRGQNARVEKGQVVKDAGGVGMVLVNVTPDSLNADIQPVPTVHLQSDKRAALLAYARSSNPTARIIAGDGTGSDQPQPPAIAGFSSRGPSLAADGDLLKPDIAAPGVDVLANVPATEEYHGNHFTLMSGTSMASPHIAGLAALIVQQHPSWSPMEVKSAMMTTATNLTDTVDPFDMGAGHVTPRQFLEPGLVFDSSWNDWASFLAGQGITYADGTPFSNRPMKASNLNVPSIAVDGLAGRESVVRYVTNVGSRTEHYDVRAWRLPQAGIKATFAPASFDIAPGATQKVTITLERTTTPFDSYAKGFIGFVGETHQARIPVVTRPVAVDAPASVKAPTNGTFTITTKSGYTGTMGRKIVGLVPNADTAATARNDQGGDFDPQDPNNFHTQFAIQGPHQGIKLETLPEYDDTDLDLYVLDSQGDVVAMSATGSGNEQVQLTGLPNGIYDVYVQAWAVHANEPTANFTMRRWKVTGDPKNLTVSPQQQAVTTGDTVRWQGATSSLVAAKSYLGLVHWTKVDGTSRSVVGNTWVEVD